MKGSIQAVIVLMIAISGACLAASGPAQQEPGLVALYTFEEGPGDTVKDWSGRGNHGKNLGAGYVKLGEGKGYCLAFDTADATVDCGNDASLDLTTALTIELWFLPQTEFTQGEAGVVGKNIDSYTLAFTPSKVCYAYLASEGGAPRTDARARLGLGSWLHIAATFDGEGAKLYVDGKLEDSVSAVAPRIRSAKDKFYLRYPVVWGSAVEPTFKCMMDDVRVYNRALSEQEILGHYKEKAQEKDKDITSFGEIGLTPHVYPLASTLLVEADYSGIIPAPPGTSVIVELWDPVQSKLLKSTSASTERSTEQLEYGHTTSVCAVSAVSAADKVQWALDTKDIPAGSYELRARAEEADGRQVGSPAAATIDLPGEPAWLKANPDGKVLNNLVTQLLDIRSAQEQASQHYEFFNPRNGWIFISLRGEGKVHITIDSAPKEDAVIVHETADPSSKETMRYLSAGAHTIEVHCEESATLESLVVRAIPEMIFDSIGYLPAPWVKCYGPYDWDFFEDCGIMDVANVFAERDALPENAERTRRWQAQGKKVLWASFIDWMPDRNIAFTGDNIYSFLADHTGLKRPQLDGTLMSEFDGFGYPTGLADYPLFAEALTRLSRNDDLKGKVFYPYGKFMYLDGRSISFMKALIDGGYNFAEEIYMQEQPTEKGARQYLDAMVRQRMLRYQAALPDCQKGMTAVLAYFTIPGETVNVEPNANYKVFMDMQMNLLANDPVFSELFGVMWYHCAYAAPEILRWSAKLLRHYCIEGNRDMLSTDPYELAHVANADFRKGSARWTLAPAEKGSIEAKYVHTFGQFQGRYPEARMGSYCLWTRRSAERPNRFSQRIVNLEPGRLYSVKMFTADYADVTKGLSEKKEHQVTIQVHDAETLPERSIREVFARQGGSYAKEGEKSNRWITYSVVFFRPNGTEARLTISDWANDKDPGGPIGQELIHNFIEVEPYLED